MNERSRAWLRVNPVVFFTSAVLLVCFLAYGVLAKKQASWVFPAVLTLVSTHFGWVYVISIAGFVGFAFWLLFSRYGRLRLGRDDERPEFPTVTWFSMLFSAGMGIGLVFYGVAEPIQHYASPPVGNGGGEEAARNAVPLAIFHWGIHAWVVYLIMALGIAYFAFRKGLPLAVRSCLYPLLRERTHGWIGDIVDIIAVFGTLFGLATSLGLGAMQVSAGLHYLFGTSHGLGTQLTLIAVITFAATLSLVSGVGNGIRRLSELNLILAGALLLFVLFAGPTGYILKGFAGGLVGYGSVLLNRTFAVPRFLPDQAAWMRSYTVFYWGWWIAWAPFVGLFVARISRGRTIRELVLGMLLVPTLVTFVWFGTFGGAALYEQLHYGGIVPAVSHDVSTAIYVLLARLPGARISSLLAAAVVAVFFVTSSDSASFVVDMLTSGGHPNPPIWQRIFWASAEGACAAVLLYAGGKQSLKALQAAVIAIGLPFCLVLVAVVVSLVMTLRREPRADLPARR